MEHLRPLTSLGRRDPMQLATRCEGAQDKPELKKGSRVHDESPVLCGDPPRAINPITGGHHPEYWQAAILLNLDSDGCLSEVPAALCAQQCSTRRSCSSSFFSALLSALLPVSLWSL